MSRFSSLPERALEMAMQAVPKGAGDWLKTGVTLGALKTGAQLAGGVLRRNPAVATAAAVGAGLLWYIARRQAKKAERGPIDSTSTRVEARRAGARSGTAGSGDGRAKATRGPRARARKSAPTK